MAFSTSVIFDGHELHDLFVVESIDRPAMGASKPTTQTVGFADGAQFVGTRREPPTVALTLAATGETMEDVRQAWATLAAWLHVDAPRKLAIGDEGGWWRWAIPTGTADASWIGANAERAKVTFMVPDERMWAPVDGSVTSSGTASLRVGGTAPARPTIVAPSASGTYALQVDGSRTMTVALGSVAKSLVIDCEARSCLVNGAPALIGLDEEFAELEPGTHSIARVGGSGAFTVTWRDSRWC